MPQHYATTVHLLLTRNSENSALPESDSPAYATDAIGETFRELDRLIADWGFSSASMDDANSPSSDMRVLDLPSDWKEGDFLQKMPPSYATLEALLDTALGVMGKAYENMLEMGHIIRHLDEGFEHQYHWTLDGDYMQLPDGTHSDIVALLRMLAPAYLPDEVETDA